jgi:hypothetical protein
MDILKSYSSIQENLDTLFTIIIYDSLYEEVLKNIENQLIKAKNINNPVKKFKINNRLFSLSKNINDNYNEGEKINSIYLVNDKIFEYKLNKIEIQTAIDYKFYKIEIINDTNFKIDYLIDLFYNFNFIYTIKLNKGSLVINKMNKNKEKLLDELKISNENKIIESIENIRKNENYKDYIIIYGSSQYFAKIGESNLKNVIISKEFINKKEQFELYENECYKKNNIELEKRLDDIKNPNTNIDLYIFGKIKYEIKEAVESYSVKELYIDNNKIERLREVINEEFLNFKIIPIKSIEVGDIASDFIKDYNGIMAIKYY